MRLNIHKKVLIIILGTGLATLKKSADYTDELLIAQLKDIFGEAEQFDDITMFALRFKK